MDLRLENLRVQSDGLESVRATMVVVVSNKGNFDVRVGPVRLQGGTGGDAIEVAVGAASSYLPAGETCQFEASISVNVVDDPAAELGLFRALVRADVTGATGAIGESTATIEAPFPLIRAPRFIIQRIKIKQAELINTRFEVVLRVENPNSFPVRFDQLDYELHGEGRFWARGNERERIFAVAPRAAEELTLELVMNFIDMKRSLLDQIIRLENVNFRFAGTAHIRTDLSFLPEFPLAFDQSGRCQVVR